MAGSRNYINMLQHSPVFARLAEDHTCSANMRSATIHSPKAYYLADGIYPHWLACICEDNTITSRSDNILVWFVTGELQKECRASIWCATSLFCYCLIPCSYLVHKSDVRCHDCLCDHA
jgi:hypothetical protein